MEQNVRFGLILGRLAMLKIKKIGPIMSNFQGVFFMFSGSKNKFRMFSKIL